VLELLTLSSCGSRVDTSRSTGQRVSDDFVFRLCFLSASLVPFILLDGMAYHERSLRSSRDRRGSRISCWTDARAASPRNGVCDGQPSGQSHRTSRFRSHSFGNSCFLCFPCHCWLYNAPPHSVSLGICCVPSFVCSCRDCIPLCSCATGLVDCDFWDRNSQSDLEHLFWCCFHADLLFVFGILCGSRFVIGGRELRSDHALINTQLRLGERGYDNLILVRSGKSYGRRRPKALAFAA
jgi:hypothetical protein